MKRRSLLQTIGMAAGAVFVSPVLAQATYTRFLTAVVRDDFVTVRDLLQQGMDPNTVNEQGQPALVLALHRDALRVAQELMRVPHIDLNAANPQGETALMLASIKGHIDLVRVMLFANARINHPGWSPLHYAASAATPDSVEIAALLLEHHAVIDALSPNRTTPVMLAAQYGSEGMVRLLVRAGADLQLRNQLGLDVVAFAQRSERAFMVRLVQAAQARQQQARNPGVVRALH